MSEEAILKAGGAEAQQIILKAHDIVETAEVFASRGIGYGGQPTTGCWALTVIVRYDPKATEFLNDVFSLSQRPEPMLYAIAGLIALDENAKKRFSPEVLPKKLLDAQVQEMSGCVGMSVAFRIALHWLLKDGASYYLYEKLPSIYRTVEAERSKTSK